MWAAGHIEAFPLVFVWPLVVVIISESPATYLKYSWGAFVAKCNVEDGQLVPSSELTNGYCRQTCISVSCFLLGTVFMCHALPRLSLVYNSFAGPSRTYISLSTILSFPGALSRLRCAAAYIELDTGCTSIRCPTRVSRVHQRSQCVTRVIVDADQAVVDPAQYERPSRCARMPSSTV